MLIEDFIVEKKEDKIILSLSHPIVSDREEVDLSFPLPVYLFISNLTCDVLMIKIKNLHHVDLVGSNIKEGVMISGSLNSLDLTGVPLKKLSIKGTLKKLDATGCENLDDIIADSVDDIKTDGTIDEEKIDDSLANFTKNIGDLIASTDDSEIKKEFEKMNDYI